MVRTMSAISMVRGEDFVLVLPWRTKCGVDVATGVGVVTVVVGWVTTVDVGVVGQLTEIE
jgi:hypothetical protein